MYGPPPNCKKNRLRRERLRKCIRPLVETDLRAHDDDPRVHKECSEIMSGTPRRQDCFQGPRVLCEPVPLRNMLRHMKQSLLPLGEIPNVFSLTKEQTQNRHRFERND